MNTLIKCYRSLCYLPMVWLCGFSFFISWSGMRLGYFPRRGHPDTKNLAVYYNLSYGMLVLTLASAAAWLTGLLLIVRKNRRQLPLAESLVYVLSYACAWAFFRYNVLGLAAGV